MEGQLLIGPGKIADQPRSLRHTCPDVTRRASACSKVACSDPCVKLWRSVSRHITDAARPQVELQSLSGSILPYSAVCVSCPSVSFTSVCGTSCSRPTDTSVPSPPDQRGLRFGPSKADPSLGSSVKNDLPKLNAISGTYQDSSGKNRERRLRRIQPHHLFQEFAGVTRSWLSMPISSRRQPR
jgi:hypothetical protein